VASPADLLARLDAIAAELAALRAEVAATSGTIVPPLEGNGSASDNCPKDAHDLADGNLLDTHAAQERFGYPRNTIALWCRTEGLGVIRGGRWLASVPRLQRRLNGG
jgi:hypothetical protein